MTAALDPLVGTTVVGRYKIMARLGGGGMGAVYRATQEPLGRAVALKVIKRSLTDDKIAVARFEKEARVMAAMQDPSIVTIYDFGTLDGSALGETEGAGLFIAMELLDGEDLGVRLARDRRVHWRFAARVCSTVCQALDVAHRAHVVHRDLKPANIMLVGGGDSPKVKVVDFGVAKLSGDGGGGLTDTGLVVGTPGYIAPEQMSGVTDEPRSDLYALGVILFESLTGRSPFDAETPVKLLLKHLAERAPSVATMLAGADAPTELLSLVDQMLLKEPELRPASADEVRRRLDALLADVRHASIAPIAGGLDNFTPTEPQGTPTPVGAGFTSPTSASAVTPPSDTAAPATPSEFFKTSPSTMRPSTDGALVPTRPPAEPSMDQEQRASLSTPATGTLAHPLTSPARKWGWFKTTVFVFAGLFVFTIGSCALVVVLVAKTEAEIARNVDVSADDAGHVVIRGKDNPDGKGLTITGDIIIDDDRVQLPGPKGKTITFDNGGIHVADAPPTPPNSRGDNAPTVPKVSKGLARPRAPGPDDASTTERSQVNSRAALPDEVRSALDEDAQTRGLRQVVLELFDPSAPNFETAFSSSVRMFAEALGESRSRKLLKKWRAEVKRERRRGALTEVDADERDARIDLAEEVVDAAFE